MKLPYLPIYPIRSVGIPFLCIYLPVLPLRRLAKLPSKPFKFHRSSGEFSGSTRFVRGVAEWSRGAQDQLRQLRQFRTSTYRLFGSASGTRGASTDGAAGLWKLCTLANATQKPIVCSPKSHSPRLSSAAGRIGHETGMAFTALFRSCRSSGTTNQVVRGTTRWCLDLAQGAFRALPYPISPTFIPLLSYHPQ
jgi:hypothetical protein